MKLIVNKDRTTVAVGTWGTKNENDYEILEFEFPEELENYNKRIVYYLGNERVWDTIVDNKAYLTNAITVKEKVKAYVWLTKENTEREADTDFRTKLFEMKFYDNENADGIVPTEQQIDGFNTMLTAMNRKIDEVNALEQTIGAAEAERQEAEATRVSNETTRESNESTRQTNEQTRQTQEADRERRTNEAIGNIKDKTAEYNANAEAKTTAFNNNATQKTDNFNANYTQKVNDFNANATTQKTDFNSNASSETSAFNSNAETKTNAFNTNATNKTNDFNSNATEKTTAFNDNASTKTSEFNSNAESKTSAFNDNAISKTNDFNDNATEKTTTYNTNAQNKIDEYDEHIVDYQAQIDELQEEVEELSQNMPWDETEQATEITVTDATKYSRNKLELFGNTEQASTSIASGDEYDSPSPEHPQPIHVVTGENIIHVNNTDYPINLGSLELCKIGEYQDYLYKENGNWYKYGVIGKVVLDSNITGSIRSDIQNENTICFRTDAGVTNILTNSKPISNYFTAINNTSDVEHIRYIGASGYRFQIFINKTKATTANEAIAWLSTHNTTVYYVLDTPTITQITDTTLISQLDTIYEHLQLSKGTNNITVTAEDLAPYMKLSYMQDLKSKLDNLDSRLSLLE